MAPKRKYTILVGAIACVAIATAALVVVIHKRQRITLKGAVIRLDADPNKQAPIAAVQVTAITNSAITSATSDSLGFFSVTLPRGFRRRQPVTFRFDLAGYVPLELHDYISDKLYLVHLEPTTKETHIEVNHPAILVSNVRVRYSEKTTSDPDVGSAVRTFQVENRGNVPCMGHHPCSPDKKWKATISSTTLDAGEGNEFRNARASCIAGPCPFTRIESENLSHGGRVLNVTARDWSDTVTFLLEAEVVHPMVADMLRESYPVIFGRALSFSLPASAEGPSIEAEINGEAIVFPLGPDLFLSWAQCTLGISKDQAKVYRCELKAGYGFR